MDEYAVNRRKNPRGGCVGEHRRTDNRPLGDAKMPHVAQLVPVSESDDPRVDDFRDLARADRRPDRPAA